MRIMTFAILSALSVATLAPTFANAATVREDGLRAQASTRDQTYSHEAAYDHCFNLATARGESRVSSKIQFNEFMNECQAGQIPG